MSNHTKGPWEYVDSDSHKGFVIMADIATNGAIVAFVPESIGLIDEEGLANARLIAQAPRLYKDLETANKQLGEALGTVADLSVELFNANKTISRLQDNIQELEEKLALFDTSGVLVCDDCGIFYNSFFGGHSCDQGECSYNICPMCVNQPCCEHDENPE